MDTVILQYAAYGNLGNAYYSPTTTGLPTPYGDMMGKILTAADTVSGIVRGLCRYQWLGCFLGWLQIASLRHLGFRMVRLWIR